MHNNARTLIQILTEEFFSKSRVIMGANIGGIYGAQLFRSDDKPHYFRAFSVACAIIAFGVLCAVCRFVIGDVMLRRRMRQLHEAGGALSTSDEGRHGAPTRVATAFSSDGNAETTDGETDEIRKSDVIVREGGELCVVDSAGGAGGRSSEMQMKIGRRG